MECATLPAAGVDWQGKIGYMAETLGTLDWVYGKDTEPHKRSDLVNLEPIWTTEDHFPEARLVIYL